MHNAACVDCVPAWVDQISCHWRQRRIKKEKVHIRNFSGGGGEERKDAMCGTGNHTRTHPTDFQSCLTVSWCLLYTDSAQSAGTNSCDSQLLETGRKTQHSIDTQEHAFPFECNWEINSQIRPFSCDKQLCDSPPCRRSPSHSARKKNSHLFTTQKKKEKKKVCAWNGFTDFAKKFSERLDSSLKEAD